MTIPLIGSLIAGGAQIAGGIMGSNSAREQNREERAWQERMAGTQYQRAVQDMRAAGLNPAMLYGKGSMSAAVGGGARMSEGQPISEGVKQSAIAALQVQEIRSRILQANAAAEVAREQAADIRQERHFNLLDFEGEAGPWLGDPHHIDMDEWGRQRGARRARLQEAQVDAAQKQVNKLEAEIKNVMASSELLSRQGTTELIRQGILTVQKRKEELGVPEMKAWRDYWYSVGVKGAYADRLAVLGSKFMEMLPVSWFRGLIRVGEQSGGANSAAKVKGYDRYSRGAPGQLIY